MKALEILNTIKNCRFAQKNYGLNFDEDELIDEAIAELELLCDNKHLHKCIDERIAELEELSDSKHTCENCKWYEESDAGIGCEKWWDCSIAKPNKWESKE